MPNITITKQTLTPAINYTYTIPDRLISLALRADGDVLVNIPGSSSTWNIESGMKESFNGEVAKTIRGEKFVFNANTDSTSTIEIRSIQ